jgi:hypothetical protein
MEKSCILWTEDRLKGYEGSYPESTKFQTHFRMQIFEFL